jgi:replicative DNA helicase
MFDLSVNHRPIEIVTLTEELMRHKELEACGGAGYIASITDGVPRRSSLSHYIAIVQEKARARRLIHAGNALVGSLLLYDMNVDEALASLRNSIDAIGVSDEGYAELPDYADEVFARIDHLREAKDELPGVTYGISGIDHVTGGMFPGEVTIVGARTGVGKSSFALGASLAVAQGSLGVYYRSDEMRGQMTYSRTLSALAGVNGFKIRSPKTLSDAELGWLLQAREEMKPLAIGIDDKPRLHVDQVLARMTQKIRRSRDQGRKEVCLCVFDFIQRMHSTGQNMREKVGYSIRAIADFSRATGVHSMVLSQITRLGKDSDGIPTLEDLKESGELEENADCIVLLWRAPEGSADPDKAIIAKQRNGDADMKVDLYFNKSRLLYQDYEPRG